MAENHTQSYRCPESTWAFLMLYTYLALKAIIILPCAVVVLHLGYWRWRQRRSSSTTSHTDVLTYNAAVFDLIFILGLPVYFYGQVSGLLHLTMMSTYLYAFSYPGPVLLHVLTCLERYLAVVHPVTYLKLRGSSGTRIRNGFLICTWLLCLGFGAGGPAAISPMYFPIFSLLAFALVTVTLSSLGVLFVLIRPKPGGGDGASQSRLRAFQTMVILTGMLWMWLLGALVTHVVGRNVNDDVSCTVLVSGYWFTLPSHLVLPLLFLHRAGKLSGCKSAADNNISKRKMLQDLIQDWPLSCCSA